MFDISSGYSAAGCYKEYCLALVDVASAISAGRTPIVRDGGPSRTGVGCLSSNERARAPLLPNHQLQPRPHFIYRAYLDVHKSHRQGDVANRVFSNICPNSRRFFRPRNPYHSIRNDFCPIGFQFLFQFGSQSREKMDELDIRFRMGKPLDVDVGRQRQ